jgi:hypothetical protein
LLAGRIEATFMAAQTYRMINTDAQQAPPEYFSEFLSDSAIFRAYRLEAGCQSVEKEGRLLKTPVLSRIASPNRDLPYGGGNRGQ